ncbi:MAG: flagellar motor protein MotB [Candidatus Anammoxibacter sp.]
MKKKKGTLIIWESDPAWLTTFGDLITLLMTFFVLLISFGTLDSGGLKETAQEIRSQLGGAGILKESGGSGQSVGTFSSKTISSQARLDEFVDKGKSSKATLDYMQGAYNEISEYLERTDLNQHLDVQLKDKELVMRIEADKIFKFDNAEFRNENLWMADSMVSIVAGVTNNLIISASVEKSFIPSKKYLNEFDLSIARSIALCRYFIEKGDIKPGRIGVSEHGKFYDASRTSDMVDDDLDYIEIILLSSL